MEQLGRKRDETPEQFARQRAQARFLALRVGGDAADLGGRAPLLRSRLLDSGAQGARLSVDAEHGPASHRDAAVIQRDRELRMTERFGDLGVPGHLYELSGPGRYHVPRPR